MITGAVQSSGDAVIPLRVRGRPATSVDLAAVVDTGFNDWLALPRSEIAALELPLRETARYTLADGSEVETPLFLAEVEWLGRWRRVLALEMEGGPLIGMAMLRDCRLEIDVTDNGRVTIVPLTA